MTTWMRLQEGHNRFRIIDVLPFYREVIHWVRKEDGSFTKKECMPYFRRRCHHRDNSVARWQMWVLHDGMVKRLEIGISIYKGLMLVNDDWGDLRTYDVSIVRHPRGTQPLYNTVAHPTTSYALSEAEWNIVSEFCAGTNAPPLFDVWSPNL